MGNSGSGALHLQKGTEVTTKRAHVRHIAGLSFIGEADSHHLVTMDSPVDGSPTSATSPMEMILVALGGCTGGDVISILQKKRLKVEGFELEISGVRTDEHPRVYTSIEVKYRITGRNIPAAAVERAIELSTTRYCSISAMLRNAGVTMSHSYTIVPPEE